MKIASIVDRLWSNLYCFSFISMQVILPCILLTDFITSSLSVLDHFVYVYDFVVFDFARVCATYQFINTRSLFFIISEVFSNSSLMIGFASIFSLVCFILNVIFFSGFRKDLSLSMFVKKFSQWYFFFYDSKVSAIVWYFSSFPLSVFQVSIPFLK